MSYVLFKLSLPLFLSNIFEIVKSFCPTFLFVCWFVKLEDEIVSSTYLFSINVQSHGIVLNK